MRLLTAHKVLISSAIVAAVCLVLYEVWAFRATRSPAALAIALAGAGMAAMLGLYLRRLLRKGVWRPGGDPSA